MTSLARVARAEQMPNMTSEKPQAQLGGWMVKLLIAAVYLCQILILYNRSTFEYILGPILAICSLLLAFTDHYYIPFCLSLLTPNAIGTAFLGRLSYTAFTAAVLVVRLFVKRFSASATLGDMGWLGLMLFNILHLYMFMSHHVSGEKFMFMLIFTAWVFYIKSDARNTDGLLNKVLLSFSTAVVTNAIASLISGTATKYANADRMGLTGVGSNDPNIAAMYITIAIAIILSLPELKLWIRMSGLLVLFFSLMTTVSISGFIGSVLIVLTFMLIMNKNKHNLSIFVLLLIGAILAVYLFPMLGLAGDVTASGQQTNYLEYYQDKIYEKLQSFLGNDLDTATSGRTEIARLNIEYLFDQPTYKQLFGGNDVNPLGINVSHNTFVDFMLRFGFIGFFAIAILLIHSLFKCVGRARLTGNCTLLLCKLTMLYWSLSLSIFDGNSAIVWFIFALLC